MGNKKNMINNFNKILDELHYQGSINENTVFYDIFGGSGLLSHALKYKFKQNRVIWNDYDDFNKRLEHIEETEALRVRLATLMSALKKQKQDRIDGADLEKVKDILKTHKGFFDCIQLSSWLCFSGNYLENKAAFLKQKCFYQRLSFSKLNAKGYLKGVERVQMDYKELIKKAYDESGEKAFLILDPPYLQTQKQHYKGKFWGIKDFLWLLTQVREDRFIFFSSEASDILEFLEFVNDDKNIKNLKNLKNLHFERANIYLASRNGDFAFYKKSAGLFEGL